MFARVSTTPCRRPGLKGIQLQDVGPGGKVRIFAAGKKLIVYLNVGPRRVPGVLAAAVNEVFGMLGDPGMIGSNVIRHEIQQQLHAALGQLLARDGQTFRSAQVVGRPHSVGCNKVIPHCRMAESRAALAESPAAGPGLRLAMAMPAGLRSQTPISQTASKP